MDMHVSSPYKEDLAVQALGRRSWQRWQRMRSAATCSTGWRPSRWRSCAQRAWPSRGRQLQRWVTAVGLLTRAVLQVSAVILSKTPELIITAQSRL